MHDIEVYWRELDALQRVAGVEHEGAVSQAFAGLLKARAVEHQLVIGLVRRVDRRKSATYSEPEYALHSGDFG